MGASSAGHLRLSTANADISMKNAKSQLHTQLAPVGLQRFGFPPYTSLVIMCVSQLPTILPTSNHAHRIFRFLTTSAQWFPHNKCAVSGLGPLVGWLQRWVHVEQLLQFTALEKTWRAHGQKGQEVEIGYQKFEQLGVLRSAFCCTAASGKAGARDACTEPAWPNPVCLQQSGLTATGAVPGLLPKAVLGPPLLPRRSICPRRRTKCSSQNPTSLFSPVNAAAPGWLFGRCVYTDS